MPSNDAQPTLQMKRLFFMNVERINVSAGICLADSELTNYFYNAKEKMLIIKIQAWNLQAIEFFFQDPILFFDHGCESVTEFFEDTSKTELFTQALIRIYGKMPESHLYKHFQFLDLDDNPCLEIISENFTFKIN